MENKNKRNLHKGDYYSEIVSSLCNNVPPTDLHHCLEGWLEALEKTSGGHKVGSVYREPTRAGFLEGLIDLGTETRKRDAQGL